MAGSRPRAWSSPQTPTEKSLEQSAGAAALSAATIAHRPSARANTISVEEAGAVPYTTMDRQMFTSNPPVKPETDEQNRAYVLHASALAMARKMYDQQQKMIDSSARAHARSSSFPSGDTASLASSGNGEQLPPVYNNLQEAAYRLAQERLTKLQEDHDKQRGFQEYYGAGTPQRTKLGTIKGKLARRRSSSDGDLLDDKQRSEQIRTQMSLLNSKLTEVDEEKRAHDRETLLAAAQRNVRLQLQQMDAKVQSDTGRVAPVNTDDWGRKALVAAQAKSAAGNHDTAGKVDIGGGKFMDRSEVEKIAAEKLQPLLDEINENAEKEAARLEEERLEEERRREAVERDKMREREIQEIHKKLKGKLRRFHVLSTPPTDTHPDQQKDEERARKAEIKQEEKTRKDEAKAIKAEQKHKEKEALPRTATSNADQLSPAAKIKRSSTVGRVRALSINFGKRHRGSKDPAAATTDKSPTSDDSSATSPTHKVRAWLLSRFPRPRAKSAAVAAEDDQDRDRNETAKRGFIGGVALSRLQGGQAQNTSISSAVAEDAQLASSLREVAMAGRGTTEGGKGGELAGESSKAAAAGPSTPPPPQQPQQPRKPRPISQVSQTSIPASAVSVDHRSVSSLSSASSGTSADGEEKFVLARSEPEVSSNGGSGGSLALTPPRESRILAGRVSPFRESRFSEILD